MQNYLEAIYNSAIHAAVKYLIILQLAVNVIFDLRQYCQLGIDSDSEILSAIAIVSIANTSYREVLLR